MKSIQGGVCAAKGFKANGIRCGIRKNHTDKDLALVVSDVPCTAAAVYTTNLVQGAPITITRENLLDGKAQAVIVNSGNANTCNADGPEIARKMCELTANALGLDPKEVEPISLKQQNFNMLAGAKANTIWQRHLSLTTPARDRIM